MEMRGMIFKRMGQELLLLGDDCRDKLIRKEFQFFNHVPRNSNFRSLLRMELKYCEHIRIFDAKICEKFEDWFAENYCKDDVGEEKYENFKDLRRSRDFMLLSFHLYKKYSDENDKLISLKSSDGVICKMDKAAAISQSEVLRHVIEDTGGGDVIPLLQVPYDVLTEVIIYCEKQHNFDDCCKSLEDCFKSLEDCDKGWVTGFVDTNRPIISKLRDAADFLWIQRLLDTISRAKKGMMGKTPEEIQNLGENPAPWAFA